LRPVVAGDLHHLNGYRHSTTIRAGAVGSRALHPLRGVAPRPSLYTFGIRPLSGGPRIPPHPQPRRFACLL